MALTVSIRQQKGFFRLTVTYSRIGSIVTSGPKFVRLADTIQGCRSTGSSSERNAFPRVRGTMYSHSTPLESHLEHSGRCRSHFTLDLVQATQLFCRRLGTGPGAQRFACRTNEDSVGVSWLSFPIQSGGELKLCVKDLLQMAHLSWSDSVIGCRMFRMQNRLSRSAEKLGVPVSIGLTRMRSAQSVYIERCCARV
jgi:hypothetical protein